MTRERYAPEAAARAVRLRARLFRAARFDRVRPPGGGIARESGRLLARECPADADLVVPVPDSGVAAAIGYRPNRGCRSARRSSAITMWAHVHRTLAGHPRFRRQAQAQPGAPSAEGKRVVLVDDSIVRGTTSRKIVRMVRQAGAREVHLRISCPPTISPCFYGVDTPNQERADRLQPQRRRDPPLRGGRFAGITFPSSRCAKPWATTKRHEYCYACYTGDYPTELVNIEELIAARQKRH
jgi:amidophosphoribosyltransferase